MLPRQRASRHRRQASERNEFPLATAKRCAACAVDADEYGCTAEAVHLYTLGRPPRMSSQRDSLIAEFTGLVQIVQAGTNSD